MRPARSLLLSLRMQDDVGLLKPQPQRVVIIGAGFAGLSVAYHLLQHQEEEQRTQHSSCTSTTMWDITILEARDRIGGRVHPCRWDEQTVVDYGGQWIHEASERNPMVQLLREDLHIPLRYSTLPQTASAKTTSHESGGSETATPSSSSSSSFSCVYDRETGRPIPKHIYKTASCFFYKTIHNHKGVPDEDTSLPNGKSTSTDVSFQSLLDEALAHPTATGTRFKNGSGDKDSLADGSSNSNNNQFQSMLHYLVHRTECYEGGRLRELSVAMADLYTNLGGPDEQPVGGYNAVLQALMDKTIGWDRVQLNTIVDTIQYQDSDESTTAAAAGAPVRITCSDGSAVLADACVCTVPLGVMQQRRIQFDPPLSTERWDAIDSIGMGILDKVLLQFDEPFWKDQEWFAASSATDIRLVQNFVDCTIDFGSPVLCMLVGGDAARRFDAPENGNIALSDEQVVAEALESLRHIFGDDEVGTPTRTHVTRWLSDPFAGGAYSFCQTGSSADAYRLVAEPCYSLQFAGEHTSLESHSCVHGAWETGQREAQRLIQRSQE